MCLFNHMQKKLKILEHASSTGPGALHKQVTSRSKSNLILVFTAFWRDLLRASPVTSPHPGPWPRTPFQPVWGHQSPAGVERAGPPHPTTPWTWPRRTCLAHPMGSPRPENTLIISVISLNTEDIQTSLKI